MVGGLMATTALIEKLEKAELKRKRVPVKVDSKKEEEPFKEVDEMWAKLDDLGKEFEEEIAYRQK